MRVHGRRRIQEGQTAARGLTPPPTSVLIFKRTLANRVGKRNAPLSSNTHGTEPLPGGITDGHVCLRATTLLRSGEIRAFHQLPRGPSVGEGRRAGPHRVFSVLPLQVPPFKGLSILTLPPAATSTWAPRSRSSWPPTSPWRTPCSRSRASAPTWPRPTSTAAPCTSR